MGFASQGKGSQVQFTVRIVYYIVIYNNILNCKKKKGSQVKFIVGTIYYIVIYKKLPNYKKKNWFSNLRYGNSYSNLLKKYNS